MKQPKFEIGQEVILRGKLKMNYSDKTAVVTSRQRYFKNENGGVTSESMIPNIALPYEFDGETLTVHYPEQDFGTFVQKAYTRTSTFGGWEYRVKAEGVECGLIVFEKNMVAK